MRKLRLMAISVIVLGLLAAVVALLSANRRSQYRLKLANGATFELRQWIVSATNWNYSHSYHGTGWDLVLPILPQFLKQKIPVQSGGGFGFGGDGNTNLVAITVLRYPAISAVPSPNRLRIWNGTNAYDACWGAHTIGLMNEVANGWQIRAFPRRGPNLKLEFLTKGSRADEWNSLAQFEIANPYPAEYPQWTPGPRVVTNGNLQVHLARFESGTLHRGTGESAPRFTEMEFAFEEDGKRTENWSVQKLVISDATGNRWFPYLDLVKRDGLSWADGGQVQFFGALWPGESAWKLDVELSRTRGVAERDQFTLELPLPAGGTVNVLTNRWEHDGAQVRFASFASPQVDHPGNLIWTGKWWGEEKDKVYSLALELLDAGDQRLQLASIEDAKGEKLELLEQRGQLYQQQAFFFKPDPETTKLTFKFTLTHSRVVQFLAHPEFVSRQ